jgi:hypothetical protein
MSTPITSYDWNSDTWTHTGDTPARTAWREAVAEIATKAKAALPECNGRVDSAVKIVLNGDVELLADGKAKVASQSNGQLTYRVVNGECDCRDFAKAPQGFCKHRLAYGIFKRARTLARTAVEGQAAKVADSVSNITKTGLQDYWLCLSAIHPAPPWLCPALATPPAPPAAPCPEAAFSMTLKGQLDGIETLLTIRAQSAAEFLTNLAAVRGLLAPPAPKSAAPGTAEAGDSTPQCPLHGVPMTQNHKDGRSWWSHKTAMGWCKGR